MRYYKCIGEYHDLEYITLDKIYKENDRGNHRNVTGKFATITEFLQNISTERGEKYFKEVRKIDYIKSINLKERLIELANTNNYAIKIKSKNDADKLDKLFYMLNHVSYSSKMSSIKNHLINKDGVPFSINFTLKDLCSRIDSQIEITIEQLLDYV